MGNAVIENNNNNDLLKDFIESFDADTLRNPNREFHQIFVTICSEYQYLDKVDNLANIIYELPVENFKNLSDVFGIGEVEQDVFSDFVNEIEDNNIKGVNDEVFDSKFSEKIVEHIRLCCFQRIYIEKNANQALSISQEASELSIKAEESAKKAAELSTTAAKSAKEAEDIKSKIYSDFISILGIFTAVSFLAMGSLQVLGDLFKGVGDPSSENFGFALVIGGIYILIIYTFLMTMFIGMRKVIGNNSSYQFTWGFCLFILIVCSTLISIGLFVLNYTLPAIIILTVGMTGLVVLLINALSKRKTSC